MWKKRHTSTSSGVSRLHSSPSESASRRPWPARAAASGSKPYSRPKLSHAAKTPGVESMSVLEEKRGDVCSSATSLLLLTSFGDAPIHVKEDLQMNERIYIYMKVIS